MVASVTTLRKQYRAYEKDPADVLDYLNNWRPDPVGLAAGQEPFLAADEVITASTWAAYTIEWVPTTDIAIDSDSHTDTTATVWLSAGVAGGLYFITNHVTTAEGRQKDWTFLIICKEQ